jgi:hypothetical protein
MKPITENIIEASAIEILHSHGWEYINGKNISSEGLSLSQTSRISCRQFNRMKPDINYNNKLKLY